MVSMVAIHVVAMVTVCCCYGHYTCREWSGSMVALAGRPLNGSCRWPALDQIYSERRVLEPIRDQYSSHLTYNSQPEAGISVTCDLTYDSQKEPTYVLGLVCL